MRSYQLSFLLSSMLALSACDSQTMSLASNPKGASQATPQVSALAVSNSMAVSGPARSPFVMNGNTSIYQGDLTFSMQGDGNLVIYQNGTAVWNSQTGDPRNCVNNGCMMEFQEDGNLVLYNSQGAAYWDTHTWSQPGNQLELSDYPPYITIVNNGSIRWAGSNDFGPFSLASNQSIQINDLKLVMQGDGNLVLYQNGNPVWATNTGGKQDCSSRTCTAFFQSDGNFVLYNADGAPFWASGTNSPNGATLQLLDGAPYINIVPNPAAAVVAPAPEPARVSVPSDGSCIATEAQLDAAMTSGADAALCPSVTIYMHQQISFTKDHQQLYTVGYPTDSQRATLIIDPSQPLMESIIDTELPGGRPMLEGVVIRNVIIDGNAQNMGLAHQCIHPQGCHGLVNLGAVSHPIVMQSMVMHSRSWTHLVLTINGGGCDGATVSENTIGPAVKDDPYAGNFIFTDGLSINCADSVISNNNIVDVTDGGIVVFSQPNVKVTNNTITAVKNRMNLAMGATDYIVNHGTFTNTVYSGNTVASNGAEGGFIYVGIAAGNHLWFANTYDNMSPQYNYDAQIVNNTFVGPAIGTGIAVSGVDHYTIQGNQLVETNMAVDPSTTVNSNLQAGYTVVPAGSLDSFPIKAFYTRRMYENLLGRTVPDSSGFTFWLTRFTPCSADMGSSVTQDFMSNPAVAGYLNSRPPQQVADAIYRAILDRPGDSGGMDFWANNFAHASSLAEGARAAVPAFFNSGEYKQLNNGGCIYSRTN